MIRLDGRVDPTSLKAALLEFVASRRSFLEGNEVGLEWVGVQPESGTVDEIIAALKRDFNVNVKSSDMRARRKVGVVKESAFAVEKKLNLFSGVEDLADEEDLYIAPCAMNEERELEQLTKSAEDQVARAAAWDNADARIVYATLRSGQRVESEHSLIVVGDVNSGAEIVAGGDIIVLGVLRGVAHAGAYDETGGGRFVFAMTMQATQLRIGSIISRGVCEQRRGPEIARIDDGLIVVEPYQARSVLTKLRR